VKLASPIAQELPLPIAKPRSRGLLPVIMAALSLVLAALLGLTVGKAPIPPAMPFEMALSRLGFDTAMDWPASAETILLQIRLPRIALAALVGGALAVAGATYQGSSATRSPIRISSGSPPGPVLARSSLSSCRSRVISTPLARCRLSPSSAHWRR
jgi:ABC-type enterobactin transport system permease subunit